VSLRVFSASGRLVRTLAAGEVMPAGIGFIDWDGQDDDGRGVAAGVYLVALDALGVQRIQRAVMVR
jgi:flagellar hook assembly protein FlgD